MRRHLVPNKGIELTASSVRSYVAPASGSSSCLALYSSKPGLSVRTNGEEVRPAAPSALGNPSCLKWSSKHGNY